MRHVYDNAIESEFDSAGKFIPDQYEEVYGFEKISFVHRQGFTLTYEKAMRFARKEVLKESDSTKAEGYLHWVCAKSSCLFNGHFEFYILAKISSSTTKPDPRGAYSVITHYVVFSFNPWTSAYKGKKKMKTIDYWEKIGGVSSGLLPDLKSQSG